MTTTINASTSSGLVTTPDNSGAIALQNAGVTGLNIAVTGQVTTPLQPSFRVALSGDVSVTSGATPFKIPYNVEDFDVGSNFDTSTNRFVAPVAGKYVFFVTYNPYNIDAGNYSRSSLYKNGGLYQHLSMNYSDTTGDHVYTSSAIINLAANDYVEAFTQSSDNSYGLSGTFTWNTFSGYLLG